MLRSAIHGILVLPSLVGCMGVQELSRRSQHSGHTYENHGGDPNITNQILQQQEPGSQLVHGINPGADTQPMDQDDSSWTSGWTHEAQSQGMRH